MSMLDCTAMQSQKGLTACFSSKHLPPFGLCTAVYMCACPPRCNAGAIDFGLAGCSLDPGAVVQSQRQYLLTWKVSRYRLLALQGRVPSPRLVSQPPSWSIIYRNSPVWGGLYPLTLHPFRVCPQAGIAHRWSIQCVCPCHLQFTVHF